MKFLEIGVLEDEDSNNNRDNNLANRFVILPRRPSCLVLNRGEIERDVKGQECERIMCNAFRAQGALKGQNKPTRTKNEPLRAASTRLFRGCPKRET